MASRPNNCNQGLCNTAVNHNCPAPASVQGFFAWCCRSGEWGAGVPPVEFACLTGETILSHWWDCVVSPVRLEKLVRRVGKLTCIKKWGKAVVSWLRSKKMVVFMFSSIKMGLNCESRHTFAAQKGRKQDNKDRKKDKKRGQAWPAKPYPRPLSSRRGENWKHKQDNIIN